MNFVCQTRQAPCRMGHGAGRRRYRAGGPSPGGANGLGRTIIDGAYSYFKDDVRARPRRGRPKGRITYVGTGGGVWDWDRGYCLMIGGPRESVERLYPISKTLRPRPRDIPRTPGPRENSRHGGRKAISIAAHGGTISSNDSERIERGYAIPTAEGFDILRGVAADDCPQNDRYQSQPLATLPKPVADAASVIGYMAVGSLTAMALAEESDAFRFQGRRAGLGRRRRWTVRGRHRGGRARGGVDLRAPIRGFAPARNTRLQRRCCRPCDPTFGGHDRARGSSRIKGNDRRACALLWWRARPAALCRRDARAPPTYFLGTCRLWTTARLPADFSAKCSVPCVLAIHRHPALGDP